MLGMVVEQNVEILDGWQGARSCSIMVNARCGPLYISLSPRRSGFNSRHELRPRLFIPSTCSASSPRPSTPQPHSLPTLFGSSIVICVQCSGWGLYIVCQYLLYRFSGYLGCNNIGPSTGLWRSEYVNVEIQTLYLHLILNMSGGLVVATTTMCEDW